LLHPLGYIGAFTLHHICLPDISEENCLSSLYSAPVFPARMAGAVAKQGITIFEAGQGGARFSRGAY
jgi:hypothetical protein